jgi:hypothetical protein
MRASPVAAGVEASADQPRSHEPARGDASANHWTVGRAMTVDWTQVDWEDLMPRLLLLAASRLSRLRWRGTRSGAPSIADAEDFVSEAITKTMGGVRVWNRDTCSLFQHLQGVIVSDINHAAESWDNRRMCNCPTAGDAMDRPGCTADPETVAAWRSEEAHLLCYLRGHDPEIGRLAELCLVHDLRETEDLSRRLGVPPAEVQNRRKRMKRAVHRYLSGNGT